MLRIALSGAKGGVGKTYIAVKLARWLREKNCQVGFFDADFTTGNAPDEIGFEAKPQVKGGYIEPGVVDGIKVLSQSSIMKEAPVLLNSSERTRILFDYLKGVNWEVDYLLIDTPSTLGEESKFAAQESDIAFVISTATRTSILDTERCINTLNIYFNRFGHPISLGVIMNMAYYNNHGDLLPLFMEEEVPKEVRGLPVLASIPYRGFEMSMLDKVGDRILIAEKGKKGENEQ